MSRAVRPIRIEVDVAYVTLTKGYEAIIDAADVPLVEGWNWYASVNGNAVYGKTKKGSKGVTITMHRVIMGNPDGFEIDHIDGNGLNNRKSNLRLATHCENNRNRKINKNNTSGFKGVTWDNKTAKWRAKIMLNYVTRSLGYFDTPAAAYAAYVAASEKLHGEFGRVA
jgi:hypothetical protein